MPEWLMQLLTSGGIPIIIVGAGYLANRKLGIASGQKTLVETLQGEVAAYERKVNRLEREFGTCKTRLEDVEAVNEDLKEQVFELRTELQNAMLRINRPKSRRTRTGDDA